MVDLVKGRRSVSIRARRLSAGKSPFREAIVDGLGARGEISGAAAVAWNRGARIPFRDRQISDFQLGEERPVEGLPRRLGRHILRDYRPRLIRPNVNDSRSIPSENVSTQLLSGRVKFRTPRVIVAAGSPVDRADTYVNLHRRVDVPH